MEDSSILELNIKGLYTKIGDSEVSWGVKVTKVVDLGTICVCVCVCVCVANKIYLAALPEALFECKLPALSHPRTFNSPLSNIRFHCLPCLPTARYRYLHISSTS